MTEASFDLVLEILGRIQADISDLKADNSEIKTRLGSLETQIAHLHVQVAEISVRMDRRDETHGACHATARTDRTISLNG